MKFVKFFICIFVILFNFFYLNIAIANDFDHGLTKTNENIGYTKINPNQIPEIIGTLIKSILAFVGVIFMVLIWMGAFDIMSAAGNEEAVKRGKNKIKNGAIGILIIFVAYFFTKLVLFVVSDDIFITKLTK